MSAVAVAGLFALGALVVIGWLVALVWLIESRPGWRVVAFLVATTFLVALVVTAGVQASEREDDTFRHKGGQGPATECWYEVEDDVVMVGKVPVHSDNTYTVCSLTTEGPR